MPLHICHITTVHKAFDNRIFHKECKSLQAAGHKVSLMVAGTENGEVEGINIISLSKFNNRKKHFFKVSIGEAFRKAKELKADVYHFHDPELMVLGLRLKMSGQKVVYDVHENNPASIMSKPYLRGRLKKRLIAFALNVFEKFAAGFFDGIITATEDIAKRFKSRKPVVLRNFPILPEYSSIQYPRIKKERPAVIFAGGMSEIRGIKELITAFEQIDEAELWLLGPFESEDFKKQCEQLPGWHNVRHLGTVGAQEIFGYIKLADIGVVTYLPYPNHITAMPTKPFEYMACGLPLLMSDFPYWRQFFRDCAEYVDPAESSQIAAKIKEMLARTDELEKMSKLNLQLARDQYNWKKEKEKLIDFYVQLENKIKPR